MSDDRQAAKAEASAKHRVAVERMRRQWAVEGYDPRAHLQAMTCEGEKYLFIGWCRYEQAAPPPGAYRFSVASWLALHDMMDMMRIARR